MLMLKISLIIDTNVQCGFDGVANAEIPTAAYGINVSCCGKLFWSAAESNGTSVWKTRTTFALHMDQARVRN